MTLPNPTGARFGIVKTPLERAVPKQPDKSLAEIRREGSQQPFSQASPSIWRSPRQASTQRLSLA